MISKAFALLVCLYTTSLAIPYPGHDHHQWLKLNNRPVCFGTGNDQPSRLFTPSYPGFVAAVKLVHRSGKVTCDYRIKSVSSNWGCYNLRHIENTPLNVFVTDERNTVLFPKVGVTFTSGVHRQGKWYSVPGFDSKSDHLVLQHGFDVPLYVGPKTKLKLWYGEDLYNYAERDNRGRVCADVYGYFM